MNATHYVLIIIGALVMAAQFVAGAFPQYAALAHAIAGVLSSVATTLGIVSPSAVQAPAAPMAPQVAQDTQALDNALKAAVTPQTGAK